MAGQCWVAVAGLAHVEVRTGGASEAVAALDLALADVAGAGEGGGLDGD